MGVGSGRLVGVLVVAPRQDDVDMVVRENKAGGASDRPASRAAMPPAAMAMIRTMMRAGFMTLHFPQITLRSGRCATLTDCRPGTVAGHARFEQLNVKAWLMAGI